MPLPDGTYELVGPKVNGNAERFDEHRLLRHGASAIGDVRRTFDDLRAFLGQTPIEGLVFAHEDGRTAKIRRADFGFAWPVPEYKDDMGSEGVIITGGRGRTLPTPTHLPDQPPVRPLRRLRVPRAGRDRRVQLLVASLLARATRL